MVIKEVKEHIKIIEGLDEVVESDNITEFDKYGNVISHKDDVGNGVDVEIEYYEQDGDEPPSVKTKTVTTKFLNKTTECIITRYTKDGRKFCECGHIYNTTTDKDKTLRQIYTIEYNLDGPCNYEKFKIVSDADLEEVFTITAKLPSEVEHADDKGMDNVFYFVDKNDLVTRCEVYDDKGRLIKKEEYPNNRMYVYGYYEDTQKLSSYGIFSMVDDKILYIEENKFDDNGRVVYSEISSYEDATNTQNWLKYDENGNCISHSELVCDLTGESTKKPKTTVTRCKYNENNHIIESNKEFETHTYSYKYYE